VGHAVSITGWPTWLKPTIVSMLPGPCGCLGPGIRKWAERREKDERKENVQTHDNHRKEAATTKDNN
jgi:hypothetical protein